MSFQFVFPQECFPTGCVSPPLWTPMCLVSEAFPTDITQIELLTCVGSHVDLQRVGLIQLFNHRSRFDVCFQSAPLPKLFPADPAQKQLLLRMDSHVSLHVFFKAKAPTTHAANTWSLPSGTSHMPHQISILSKRFPADSADKWFLSCVCSHVQLRVFVAFKMFAANFTVIYLGVSLQAKLQGFLGLKMFPTHATHICILLAFLHMLQERGSRKTC